MTLEEALESYNVVFVNECYMITKIKQLDFIPNKINDKYVKLSKDVTEELKEKDMNKLFINNNITIKKADELFEYEKVDSKYILSCKKENTNENIIIPAKIDGVMVELQKGIFANSNIITAKVEEGVTQIPRNCFLNSTLQKIDLPTTIKEINDNAFRKTLIEEIDLKNIEKLGEHCFNGCVNLKHVKMSPNIKEIKTFSFTSCLNLKEIDLKNVKKIGSRAFDRCLSLEKIRSKSLEEIDSCAFEDCSIKDIYLNNVKNINNSAFENCSLGDIRFDNELTINEFAFYKTNIKKIRFSKPPILVQRCFYRCDIDEISFNKSTKLTKYCFASCNINNVIINKPMNIDQLLTRRISTLTLNDTVEIFNEDTDVDLYPIINNFTDNRYSNILTNDLTNYEELKQRGFNSSQINQILKAQQDGILISSIMPSTPIDIIRFISSIKNVDSKLFNTVLKMCNKNLDLTAKLEIEKIISDYEKSKEEQSLQTENDITR